MKWVKSAYSFLSSNGFYNSLVFLFVASVLFSNLEFLNKNKNLEINLQNFKLEMKSFEALLNEERDFRQFIEERHQAEISGLIEKYSILEESIDPQNFRWAKIKKVRAAVQQTIKDFGYVAPANTSEITQYASSVVDYSEKYDVPIPLILSMTRKESAFNPRAKSHAGAMGIIQVMPSTARDISIELGVRHYSMYKIHDNVRFGVYYIMKMLDIFDGDVNLAVAAYNAGPTYVKKVISGEYSSYPRETKTYVNMILGDEENEGFIKYYEGMGL